MKIPFLGQAYTARSPNLAADRCVNLYPEMAPEGKEVGAFFGTPGLEQIQQSGDGPIRGAFNYFNVTFFFVSGTTLYFTDSLSVAPQALGTIAGTGRVMMTANQEQKLLIVASPNAYIYDLATATLTLQTLPPMGGSCDFIAQFFIFEEKDTSFFYIYDGIAFDAADIGVAEGTPDHLVRTLVDHREAWLFGQLSTEVWAFTGNADFPLEFIPGALIPQGCAARFTPARLDNSVFWLGRNENGQGIVWRANGYTPVRVSTHAVEFAIASYGDISDAFAETYQQEGHSFYVLTFPTAGKTWVFDASTNMWHERASLDGTTGELGRWRPNTLTFFQGEIVAGDSESGKLFTLSLDNYTDGNYGPVTGLVPEMATTDSGANSKLAAARVVGSPLGYLRTEILTLEGGTYTTPAQVMVAIDTVGGTSAANVVAVVEAGDYTVVPSNPVSTTAGSGSGTGLTLFAFWTTGSAIEIAPESGAGYTAVPTISIDATYGQGATATAVVQLIAAKGAAGAGYAVNDVLTLAGGTFTTAAQLRVEEVTLGAPSALAIIEPGAYTVVPTGFIGLTGGTGAGGTCTGLWGVGEVTLTAAGSEYSQAPAVTITGLGVGASLTAEVDSTTNWIKWIRSCRALPQGASSPNRTTHHALQLYGQMGVGLDGSGQGTDPQVMLRWSDDGGHTWSNEHWRSMGRIGETGNRCIWRRLGSTAKLRDRVYEFSGTDPVKRAFTGAELILTGNAS
jgi:hypothetical protein